MTPSSPYRGLAPFEDSELDALFFFGREHDSEVVVANLIASRFTVLYGPSGVGKSSLLLASVARKLRELPEEPLVIVFSSWTEDPETALAAAFGDGKGPLLEVVERVQADRDVYLVLDQAEEYFVYHGEDTGFEQAVAELVTRPLRVNVLLSLREDTLARLDRLKALIPNLFGNVLRLDRLDRVSGRAAIVRPLERWGELHAESVTAEASLVENVLDGVGAGRIELGPAGGGGQVAIARNGDSRIEAPYLQLVMQRLWDVERAAGSTTLRAATLAGLGGAGQVVADHLERAIDALMPQQQAVAAVLFDHLVTPSGTKIAHEASDLALFTGRPEGEVRPVLASLVEHRILRTDEGGRYEIFHDVLAAAIVGWTARYRSEQAVATERRRRRRAVAVAAVALAAVGLMTIVTAYALEQRSEAHAQAAIADTQRARAAQQAAAASLAKADAQKQAEKAESEAARAESEAAAAQAAEKDAEQQAAAAAEAQSEAQASAQEAQSQQVAATQAQNEATEQAERARAGEAEALRQRRRAEGERQRAVREARAAGVARQAALDQARLARARQLTAEAASLVTSDPEQSVQLALRAARVEPSERVERTLRQALAEVRVRAVLPGGGGPIRAVSTSADGSTTVVAGAGGEARVYSVSSGRRLARVRHGSRLNAAEISRDGRTLATAGADGRVRLWDARTGATRGVLNHGAAVTSIAFSPDGRLIVSAGTNEHANVWDVASGERIRSLSHPFAVDSVSFGGDGRLLLTRARDVRVWDVADGRLVSLLDQRGDITVARFSPDASQVLTGGRDDIAVIWNAATGEPVRTLRGHVADVRDVAWSSRGDLVATASSDNSGRVWRASNGDLVSILARHVNHLMSLAFTSEGLVVTGSRDGTVRLWGGTDFSLSNPLLGHLAGVTYVGVTPDGRTVLSGSEDGSARLWRSRIDPELTVRWQRPGVVVRTVAFHPGGRLLASGGADGTARILRRDGSLVRELEHGKPVTKVAFSPDGALLLTASEDGVARAWRVADGRLVRTYAHGAPLRAAAYDRRGTRVATAGDDGIARVWNARTGRLEHVLRHGSGALNGVAFSPNGSRIATAGEDGNARLWNARGRLLRVLTGHQAAVNSVAFSPDGASFVTASTDADARVWDVRGRALGVRVLRGHSSVVSDASFSRDGRWIVTAGPITVGIWEAIPGRRIDLRPLFFLRGHASRVRAATFGPDGAWIASASNDGSVRTYICQLCQRLPGLMKLAERRFDGLGQRLTAAERRRYLGG